MKWVKVRETFAALVAIVLVVLGLAVGSALAGWNIPILRDIAGFIGVGNDPAAY